MTEERREGRTRRSPDGAFASTGAVRQSGGKLPIYICNTCGGEVVWAEGKTGRKYLANVFHGYLDQRFYIAARLHDCAPALADMDERDWKREHDAHYDFLFMLMDEHDDSGHADFTRMCRRCERALTIADMKRIGADAAAGGA